MGIRLCQGEPRDKYKMVKRGLISCLCLCFLVRLILILLFPQLGSILDQTVQFSTPVTSFKSLKEGIFLLNHSLGLYEGGVVYLPPLLLQFANLFHIGVGSQFMSSLLFIFMDCLFVWQLYSLEFQLNQTSNCAWIFALNPITILSCISKSSIIFTYLPLLSSIYFVSIQGGNIVKSSLMMSIATYLDPIMGILLIPTLNFITRDSHRSINRVVFYLINFIIYLALLYWISPFPLLLVYSKRLHFDNVVPNMGLWWYFFIEMFQEFIPFFKSVFNLFSMGMIIPLTVRFNNYYTNNPMKNLFPLYCWVISLGWLILTKPYPTLGETGIFLSLLPLFVTENKMSILKYMRYPMFITLLFLHSVLLSPIFYHLWIDLGSGNSNFFYAISLVYNLALGLLIADITWGVIRLEYDDGKPNYTRKLTQV